MLPTGSTKGVPKGVLSCLCDTACKRYLAICRKSRASCPVGRLLSVPISPLCAEQGRLYDILEYRNKRGHYKLNPVQIIRLSIST